MSSPSKRPVITLYRAWFLTYLVDKTGEPKDVTLHELLVRIGSGANLQKIKPVHVGLGTYSATFTIDLPGNHAVDLWYEDHTVLSKPENIRFYSCT